MNAIIISATDPEMQRIEALARECGLSVHYATAEGTRVHPGNAYRADGIDPPLPDDIDPGAIIAVETDGPAGRKGSAMILILTDPEIAADLDAILRGLLTAPTGSRRRRALRAARAAMPPMRPAPPARVGTVLAAQRARRRPAPAPMSGAVLEAARLRRGEGTVLGLPAPHTAADALAAARAGRVRCRRAAWRG